MLESSEISPFDPHHPALSSRITSVGVFAVVANNNCYVSVCQVPGGWSIPAGRVKDTDQGPLEAAMREFGEETDGGGFDSKDVTHMGIVGRRLVFRVEIDLYNLGIDHHMVAGSTLRIGGDEEVRLLMFRPMGEMLLPPIYRPEINTPVVKAFSL